MSQTAFDPFEERPFCAVDSLVFAWLSYLRLPGDMAELTNWQGLDVRELLRAECYQDMIGDLWDPEGSQGPVGGRGSKPSATVAFVFAAIVAVSDADDNGAVCGHDVPISGGV